MRILILWYSMGEAILHRARMMMSRLGQNPARDTAIEARWDAKAAGAYWSTMEEHGRTSTTSVAYVEAEGHRIGVILVERHGRLHCDTYLLLVALM